MTGPKMEYEWKILFESMNSMNAPGYTSEEISVLLTQAEYEMVIEVAQNASDSNDYARMVLGKLLTPYSNPTIAPSTVLFSENAYRVTLPTGLETPTPIPEFFYPFIEFAVTTTPAYERAVKPIDYNSYYTSISNPFAKPYVDLFWRVYENGYLTIITDGTILTNIKGLYIKKPPPIITAAGITIDGISVATNCVLHEIVHREIIRKAVRLAMAAMKDQAGYQIQNIEENQ